MHFLQFLLLLIVAYSEITIGNSLSWSGSNIPLYKKIMASIERSKRYLHSTEFQNDFKYVQVVKGSLFVFYHIDDTDLKNPIYPSDWSTNGNVFIVGINYFTNTTFYKNKISEEEDEYRAERIPIFVKVNFNEESHKVYYLSWIYYSEINDKIQWTNFLQEYKSYTHINPISEDSGEIIGQIICSSINCNEPTEFTKEIRLPMLLHELHKCHKLKTSKQEPKEQKRDLNYWQQFPEKYKTLCKNRFKTEILGQDGLREYQKVLEIQQKLMLECNDDVEKIIDDLILDKEKCSKSRFTEILMRSNCKLNNFNSSKVFIHFFSEILEELTNYDTNMPNSTNNATAFDAIGCNGSNSTQLLSHIVFLTVKNLRTLQSCHSISIINGLIDYIKSRIQSAESIIGPVGLYLNPNEPNCILTGNPDEDDDNDIEDDASDDDTNFTLMPKNYNINASKEVGLMHDSTNERNQEPIAASILAQHQRQAPSAISGTEEKKTNQVKHSEGNNAENFINTCDIKIYGALLKILLGFQDILLNPIKYANLTKAGNNSSANLTKTGNKSKANVTRETHPAEPSPGFTMLQVPAGNKDTFFDFVVGNPTNPIMSSSEKSDSKPDKAKELLSRLKKKLLSIKKAKSKGSKQNKKSSGTASLVISFEQDQDAPAPKNKQLGQPQQQKVFNTWSGNEAQHETYHPLNKHSSAESLRLHIGDFTSDQGRYKRGTDVDRDTSQPQEPESGTSNSRRPKRCTESATKSDSVVFNATLSNCFYEFWTILHKLIEQACIEIKTIVKDFSGKNPVVQKLGDEDTIEKNCSCTIVDDESSGQAKSILIKHLENSLNYVKDQISNQCKE